MKKVFVDFKKLKERVSIREVIERYGWLSSMKEQADRLSGPCPLCEGETSSLRVSQEKNCFKCFRCEARGNILDLVAAKENCSIRAAALLIAEWFEVNTGKTVAKTPNKKEPPTARQEVQPEASIPETDEMSATMVASPPPSSQSSGSPENPPLTFQLKLDSDHPWFNKIGLLPETVSEFGLGFCAKGVIAGRIAFPLHDTKGQLIGYAGRWPDDNPPEGQPLWKYPKNLNLCLVAYPIHRLMDSGAQSIRMTGNPLDVAMGWQAGIKNLLALPAGEIKIQVLREFIQR